MTDSRRRSPGWILAVLLAVFALAPLTYPGFFQAQSGFLPAFNAGHLAEAPAWGRVADPVRGEGKLPYLLAWPFLQLSGSGIAAVKWGYALAFILGALGAYAWTRPWLGTRGAILAATVYTYLPWHLATVYVRGAYAEAWLWACWPFCLWAIDRLREGRLLPAILVGLPALAAAFWIQPGLFALSIPLLAAYAVLAGGRRPWPLARLVAALALSFLLLWFVGRAAPASREPFAAHFLYPFQLLSAAWGDGLSFQLGLAATGLTIVALALWAGRRSAETAAPAETGSPAPEPGQPPPATTTPLPLGRVLWFWLVALLLIILLVLPVSAFMWRATGLDALLTYPWQLLALAGMPLAFLAGSVVRLDRRLAALPAWAGLLAFVVLASYPYLSPAFTRVDPGPEPLAMIQVQEPDAPPVGAYGRTPPAAPQIMLLDYQVAPPTEITPTLTVTFTWQAVAPVVDDYTVFVHVLDQAGDKAAQRDSRPCDGECPTTSWQPGAIVVDRQQLNLPPGAPPGPYRLAVGMYLLESGERALVVGRDDGTVVLNVP